MKMADQGWRSEQFRQKILVQLDDEVRKSKFVISKNSMEMEEMAFNKAKTKEEYFGFIARIILHIREKGELYYRGEDVPER
ncbi:mediator complex subunit Med15 [Chamberlinius hualienensis]